MTVSINHLYMMIFIQIIYLTQKKKNCLFLTEWHRLSGLLSDLKVKSNCVDGGARETGVIL